MRSPEHLVPDAAPVSSQRLQAPSRHHGPALYQPVNYRSRGQSALISGFPLSAILGKPFPAKAADTPNPHRRPNAHRFPAGSFFGGFRTPALYPGSTARDAPASETLHASRPPNRVPSVRYSPLGDNPDIALDAHEPRVIVLDRWEQVTIAVEGHLDRGVTQQCLQPLRGKPGLDPHRG